MVDYSAQKIPSFWKKINVCSPDIIVMTGDIIDRHRIEWKRYLDLLTHLSKTYPVYYIWGNHETQSPDFIKIRAKLKKLPIILLEDDAIFIEKDSNVIQVIGVSDPYIAFEKNYLFHEKEMTKKFLERLKKVMCTTDEKVYRILLSHRPEYFKIYGKLNIDLVFSGHAHGGQFRIPGIGGLIAPHQGFFPKYSEGCHRTGKTTMVVSRGLGNSLIPFRIGNPPELVLVELKCK